MCSDCRKFTTAGLARLFIALAVLILASVQPSFADKNPSDCFGTGINGTLNAYRCTDPNNFATCIPIGGSVATGETIYYRGSYFPPNLGTCGYGESFPGGVQPILNVTKPDGTTQNVSVADFNCLGCTISEIQVNSLLASYLVSCADEESGSLNASINFNGFAHNGDTDQTLNATLPSQLPCVACSVTLDKQVSCTSAAGPFVDIDALGSTEECSTIDGLGAWAKYVVNNTGDLPATCTLGDGNTFFVPGGSEVLSPIASLGTTTIARASVCSDDFDALEPDTATLNCSCAGPGGTITLPQLEDTANINCLACNVEVDKQVSCDGVNFVDQGYPSDGSNTCIGFGPFAGPPAVPASTLILRWFAQNISDPGVALENCRLSDTNSQVGAGPFNGAVAASAQIDSFNGLCTGAVATEEAAEGGLDTGAILCDCRVTGTSLVKLDGAADSDTAGFSCQNPNLVITKECADQTAGNNPITITVDNPGAANLTNCTVTDTYNANNPLCPVNGGANSVILTGPAQPFTLGPSGQVQFTGTIVGLTDETCNKTVVTCNIGDTATQISSTATDQCPVTGEGCFTHTPGFWKNHPAVTSLFLPLLNACGTKDYSIFPDVAEAMCVSGQDAKEQGKTMTQLQLERQCVAANLNQAATNRGGGNCAFENGDFETIDSMIASCCGTLCETGTKTAIDASHCIDALDAFNNTDDTLAVNCNDPNDPLIAFCQSGPADTEACKEASAAGKKK